MGGLGCVVLLCGCDLRFRVFVAACLIGVGCFIVCRP